MATGLIDFHSHFVGGLRSEAAVKWPLLADEQALERSLEAVSVRVVSTPLEFVPGVPAPRINDSTAGLVSKHRDRLVGGNAAELLAQARARHAG